MGEIVHTNQRTARSAGRLSSLLRSRAMKLIILPIAAVGAILAFTFAAQAMSDDNTSRGSGQQSGASAADKRQEASTMRNDSRQNDQNTENSETVQDDGDGSTTQVTVNGESITVPANGSYHRNTDDGTTRTEIHVDNRNKRSTSGNSSSNSSSSKIEVNMQSNSSSETE